jgi:hypothetical protein
MHVVAGAAVPTEAARDQRVNDDGIADRDVLDGRAHRVYPAGVLVAEDVGEPDMALVLPLAFDDVEVGPAQPGPADAHDDIERPGDFGLGHFLDRRPLAVRMQADSLHGYFLLSV